MTWNKHGEWDGDTIHNNDPPSGPDTDPCDAPLPSPPPLPREAKKRTTIAAAAKSHGVQWGAIVTAAFLGISGMVGQCNDGTAEKLDAIDSKIDFVVDRIEYVEDDAKETRDSIQEVKGTMRAVRSRVAALEEERESRND